MTCIEKAKNKIKNMGFNEEQSLELSNLVELIIGELDEINSSVIYDNIKKNTMELIDKNIFTNKDIPKLIKVNNGINVANNDIDVNNITSTTNDHKSGNNDHKSGINGNNDYIDTDNDSVNISIEI